MAGWDYEICLLVAGVIVILYTAVGGYLAVTYTDWLQVVLLLFGVVVVGIPVAMAATGSWSDMRGVLPDSYYDLGAQGWDRIAALVVSMVLAFFVGMDSFSRSFAARSPGAARNGALLAAVLIVPLAVAAVWLGLSAAVLYPDHGAAGSSVLATFVLDRFPAGLKGLMLVAVLSAIMSTADICILTASANYTRDIHQRYIRPGISQREIIDILQLGFTINAAGLFLPTIAALYGNRVSAGAAFWSIGASLVTVVGWRIAADAGAGGLFAIDPLWPGLAVSAVLLVALTAAQPRRAAGTAT
jgi:SSS family solute:Na+ symporter